MPVQIQFRRGTEAEWAAANPVLALAEMGIETDTQKFKIGNGSTAWIALPYGGVQGPPGQADPGLFIKADSNSVVFTKVAAGSAEIKAGTIVVVNGVAISFPVATAIIMPSLVGGTDYAIYACLDGTVRADSSFIAPVGYTTGNSRQIGGFHYAPGENATAFNTGGNTSAAINAFSFWDLKWRPACPDPRGMTLVAGSFWCDIYLLGVDHHINGTSRNNVTIADGSSPPKLPAAFGGNGASVYGNLNWWTASEVLRSHGKQPLTYDEFAAAAFGVQEVKSRGNDPITTGLATTNAGSSNADSVFTSAWGVIQATGCLYVWGADFGGGAAGTAWVANTGSRGSTNQMENVALLGGSWLEGSGSGSRSSGWSLSPPNSAGGIGARGRSDHLRLA
jgi:hypothetical protein